MDPNALLDAIRDLRIAIAAKGEFDRDLARDFAELFQNLDEWLSRGGFLPADWMTRP